MLISPGPVEVPAGLLAIAGSPPGHHRSGEFRRLLSETGDRIRSLVSASGAVALQAGSGTLAMEAAVSNLCGPGDHVVVCRTGWFGDRFVEMVAAAGASATVVRAEPGQPTEPESLAQALRRSPARLVFAQHVDTSTGVRNDVAALGAVTRSRAATLVIDAVASIGAEELRCDDWGIGVLIAASQKGLMCPPGLALQVISSTALARATGRGPVYTNWIRRPAEEGVICAFTPPVSLIRAVHAAAGALNQFGPASLAGLHMRSADATRAGLAHLGFSFDAPQASRAAFVTVARPPGGVPAADLRLALERRDLIAARGQETIRVGHYLLNRKLEPSELVEAIAGPLGEFGTSWSRLAGQAVAIAEGLSPESVPRLD